MKKVLIIERDSGLNSTLQQMIKDCSGSLTTSIKTSDSFNASQLNNFRPDVLIMSDNFRKEKFLDVLGKIYGMNFDVNCIIIYNPESKEYERELLCSINRREDLRKLRAVSHDQFSVIMPALLSEILVQ